MLKHIIVWSHTIRWAGYHKIKISELFLNLNTELINVKQIYQEEIHLIKLIFIYCINKYLKHSNLLKKIHNYKYLNGRGWRRAVYRINSSSGGWQTYGLWLMCSIYMEPKPHRVSMYKLHSELKPLIPVYCSPSGSIASSAWKLKPTGFYFIPG